MNYKGEMPEKQRNFRLEFDQEPLAGEAGFVATCKWNMRGSVSHWGHIHERTNQYDARITVMSVDGEWKIVAQEVLNGERIS